MAVDELAQRRGIVLNQFAAEEYEALLGVAVIMLPSAPEQSGYLPRESSRNLRQNIVILIPDSGFRGVGMMNRRSGEVMMASYLSG